MNPQAEALNKTIGELSPTVLELLSERGKNIFFPKKGILGQTADAKETKINATIGAAIEDDGSPMRLETLAEKVNLDPSYVFPYAPSFGRPDLRERWQELIIEKNPDLVEKPLSLPVVTNALTHGMSMVAYLFADAKDSLIVPNLFWGNYNLIVTNAYGADLSKFNLFKDGGFDLEAFKAKLDEGGIGKKIIVLNFPNNPSGYSPTIEEFAAIVEIIKESAEKGNKILAITDDAYFGLVYEDEVETTSIFAKLCDLHENILAAKIDGPTKEDYVWGFRIGFITYGIKGGTKELYSALEAKTAGAVRGNISNASNLSQSLLLHAYEDDNYDHQKAMKYATMKERYDAVKSALANNNYSDCFEALPYNSGYFMCIKLAEGIDGESVRQLLIEKYSIGVINLNNILRIAYAAVAASDIETLFKGIYSACKEV